MSDIEEQTTPPSFDSNRAYISWEFGRLKRQLEAYIELQNDHSQADDYYALLDRLAEQRELAIGERKRAVQRGVAIPLESISRRFGLSREEEEVLLFCLTPQQSNTVWSLVVLAQGSLLKPYMEVGFVAERIRPAADLVTDRSWYKPESPLVRNGLILIESPPQEGSCPGILCQSVRVPHYVASVIMGDELLDSRLSGFCRLSKPDTELFEMILPTKTRATVDGFIKSFYRGQEPLELEQKPRTLLVTGPPQCGKTTMVKALAHAFRRPLLTLSLEQMQKEDDNAGLIWLAVQNAQFLGAVLHFKAPEQMLAVDQQLMGCLTNVVDWFRGLVLIEPRTPEQLPASLESLVDLSINLRRPDAHERELLWESLILPSMKLDPTISLKTLASTYELTGGQIKRAIDWALQLAEAKSQSATVTQENLDAGAKSQLRSRIGDYTSKSLIRLTMDDLVLPEPSMELVKELLSACRHTQRVMAEWGFNRRLVTGRGLTALFTGDPGTGKTLCAEIIAQELGVPLHIISIPKIVSKWVGETEKNIRDVFANAQADRSMLLFDEADSLFTKRVKVERSQDHYLNMEVNLFLQELERFEGIVILTTNLETNIDRAFQRRILFKIEFLLPGIEERERIWRILIPSEAPLEPDIDFRFLAEAFELSGGQIKNAIIRAAYQSCEGSGWITQNQLALAAQQQARADGRLIRSLEELRVQYEETRRARQTKAEMA